MKRRSPEEWHQLLQQWLASGQSGAIWCRENQISYQTFGYWRKKVSAVANSKSFVELIDGAQASSQSGIGLVCGSITLQISRDFDETTFLKCLIALKKLSC